MEEDQLKHKHPQIAIYKSGDNIAHSSLNMLFSYYSNVKNEHRASKWCLPDNRVNA